MAVGTWYQVAITSNGSSKEIYVNGALDTPYRDGTAPVHTSNQALVAGTPLIGGFVSGGRLHNSTIDDVILWNRALAPAEMSSLYALGVAGQTIPEPSTLVLGSLGALGLLWRSRRRSR